MSPINCRLDKEKITVGEHLNLNCSGSEGTPFAVASAAFKLPDPQKYLLKVLHASGTENNFNLDFTIYAAGDYKISDLILTDGTSEMRLSGPAVKVESVLQPSADGKPSEAFGSILPIGIHIPLSYYLLLSLLVVLLAGYSTYRVRRNIYYKKLKEKLTKHSSPLEPDTQFYRSIRLAEKAGYPLEQVEKAFRLYNLRTYQLPMFDLTNERILKYFRRNFPQHKSTRQNLNKILGEFEELQKNRELSVSDRNEFIKKLHRYVSSHKGRAS